MPAKKQKQQPNVDSGTVTIDTNYGAVPNITNIGSSMGTDTITLNNTLWSGNSITSPYTLTTSNTSSPTFRYTNNTSNAVWTTTGTVASSNTVHIDADGLTMKAGSDIKIGGKSLTQAIEKIEERLGILHPNSALEERWEKLKELRQQYMELEKDLLEKEKLMKILKEA
jgi:hypothetical protein